MGVGVLVLVVVVVVVIVVVVGMVVIGPRSAYRCRVACGASDGPASAHASPDPVGEAGSPRPDCIVARWSDASRVGG